MVVHDVRRSNDFYRDIDMHGNDILNVGNAGIPHSEEVLGSACSGVDGTANRTLTLAEATIKSDGIIIIVNGTGLHEGAGLDYTVSGNVVTFLNIIDNTDNIRVVYFT